MTAKEDLPDQGPVVASNEKEGSTDVSSGDLVYNDDETEPEVHLRTYVAVLAMCLLSAAQTFALYGPPTVLSWIGSDLNAVENQTWVPNSLGVSQAVLAAAIALASDAFQARKPLLVAACLLAFVGCAIAPGSHSIGRLIAAQTLIGVGFAGIPLAYCVPSEILPRRWRPMVQAVLNVAAALGAITGPLVIAGLVKEKGSGGWRDYYWIQMALWGVGAIGLLVAYRPPKRHSRLESLPLWEKLKHLDLPGAFILTAGITLLLVALNMGGQQFPWKSGRVLSTLILGIVLLICFGLYEWKGTRVGIIHHDWFSVDRTSSRNLAICLGLMSAEGIVLFSLIVFYPMMTEELFETRPVQLAARATPCWAAALLSTLLWGYWSAKWRTLRAPLFCGFLVWTVGLSGLATIQPGDNFRQLAFMAVAGIGFGAPLVLIISGVQLATPHSFIGTVTAVTMTFRAIAATAFTAIYAAVLSNRLGSKIPADIPPAVVKAGLPPTSIPAFIEALTGANQTALAMVPGVNKAIIAAGSLALKQAWADSLRVIFIIAAACGAVACVACLFLADVTKQMDYHVDAPIEKLHAGHTHHVEQGERAS